MEILEDDKDKDIKQEMTTIKEILLSDEYGL
jgi:hypothetical protein